MAIAASVIGHTYQVQHSPGLATDSWENASNPQAGTGGALQLLLPVSLAEDKGFYRILVTR